MYERNKALSSQRNIPARRGQKYSAPNNENNIDRQTEKFSSNVGALTDVMGVHLGIRTDIFNPQCALLRMYLRFI